MSAAGAPLICVVDDDASVREAICNLLASAGLATAQFASAEAFLLDARAENAAVIIIDIGLPGIDGLALQARLSGRGIRSPVIIVSGQADAASMAAALRAGALAVLHKPLDGERLLELVRDTLR